MAAVSSAHAFVSTNFLLLVLTAAVCLAQYADWKQEDLELSRRDSSWTAGLPSCASSNNICLRVVGCCNGDETCKFLTSNIGVCKPKPIVARTLNRTRRPYKRSRMPCVSSSECIEGCCRVYRMHRHKSLICGTESDEFMKFKCA